MIVAVSRIEDFDRFWNTFTTEGAAKRKEHGSKGSRIFRDPEDPNRVIGVFDWDEGSFDQFVKDPEMQEIFKKGGLQAPPKRAELAGEHEA
jgi:hypothetical protein